MAALERLLSEVIQRPLNLRVLKLYDGRTFTIMRMRVLTRSYANSLGQALTRGLLTLSINRRGNGERLLDHVRCYRAARVSGKFNSTQ